MKFKYLIFLFFLSTIKIYSQIADSVLFTINNEPILTNEFLIAYSKNLKIVTEEKKENIDEFLQRYINFKLKVKEAEFLKLDTLQSFKNELKQYKDYLALPYLKDTLIINNLVKEAYNRLQYEVNVSHILVFLKPDAKPQDTLAVYNKLLDARKLILKNENFDEIAKSYSQDPTVVQNAGNIGYFTALQLVYSFENTAYSTPINKVSMPFRTKFGYHILKVNDKRPARGEVEVAHIMIKNNSVNAKIKIDSVYRLLIVNKENFNELAKKISEDKESAIKGGQLPRFGTGKMIEEFADVAFSLQKENEISKPFQSRFGWHIIKLIKKYPPQSFREVKLSLTEAVENDERSNIVYKRLIDSILKIYKVTVNNHALKQFSLDNWEKKPQNFNRELFSIEKKIYTQRDFIDYLKKQFAKNLISTEFLNFRNQSLIEYYKDQLEFSNPIFAANFREFKDGLLVFDLLEKEIWNKPNDSTGTNEFYKLNKNDLKVKTSVTKDANITSLTDHQKKTENQLTEELRKKFIVKINNNIVKTLKNKLKQNEE